MPSLAKILFEFSEVMERIESQGGQISDDMLPMLTHLEMQISEKVDRYVYFYDAVKAQIERTKKTIDSLKTSLKTLENLEGKLKENVKHNMVYHNLLEIKGEERSIKLLNAGGEQAIDKPKDLFYALECVDMKYHEDLKDHIEKATVYVIKDKEKFKAAIRENRIAHCMVLPRSKYVRFV